MREKPQGKPVTDHRSLVTALALLLAIAAPVALGQSYPNRPIRIIDAFPAGGAGDVIARIISPRFSEGLGQPLVVENRPGAGGNIGADVAAKSPPDGYTLFIGVTAVLAPSRTLYPKLPYDALRDFAPVARVGSSAYILAVHPSLPVRSVKDLVALAKANPGQLKYASGGVGSGQHLSGELFRMRTGIDPVHVAYKGGPPAVIAVASGETEFGFMSVPAGLAQVNAGRLRAVATTGVKRVPALASVPTVAESGYPGYEVTPVFGLFVPAATPRDIIALLNMELRKVVDTAEVRERFAAQGVVASGSTPEELGAILAAEIAQWAKVIKTAGIRVD
jgi:tripartite-type tricarboxylate transporter receptor subunit TctC